MNEFWLGVMGGFSGALLGVFGTETAKFFLEPGRRLEVSRDSILSDMCVRVDEVETVSAEYWNGMLSDNSPEIYAAEQNIIAGLHFLVKETADLFEGDDGARVLCEGEIRALRILMTGGDFGDGQVLREPHTALEIKKRSGDLKRTLRRQRNKLKRRFL